MIPSNDEQHRGLLEVVEYRHDRHSAIITVRFPVTRWPDPIGDPTTMADAIPDRQVHNAYRMSLGASPCAKPAHP